MQPNEPQCYAHQVLAVADTNPERIACIFQVRSAETAETVTYSQLREKVHLNADALVSMGLQGKCAALIYPPGLDFIVTFLACLYSGVVAIPLNLSRNAQQFQRTAMVIDDASPAAVLSDNHNLPVIRESLTNQGFDTSSLLWLDNNDLSAKAPPASTAPPQQSDLAFIQYTSGSTSDPKGVMVTQGNILANQASIQKACNHKPGLVAGGWLPQFHDMGLIGHMLQPLYMGGTYVFMPPMNFIQRPRRWLELISHYRIESSAAPNFGYEHCVRAITDREDLTALDLSCWKVALNGSEPVNEKTMTEFSDKFAAFGFDRNAFFPCYGMAETTLFVSGGKVGSGVKTETLDKSELHNNIRAPSSQGVTVVSCGHISNDFTVKIVNPDTSIACLENEIGEIWIRGEGVARGYWNNTEKSQELFNARLIGSDETFLRTGDLGYISDGELYVTGRIKELIILRGRNIYPYDIERTCNGLEQAAGATAVTSLDLAEKTLLCAIVEIRKNILLHTSEEALKLLIRSSVMDAHDVNLDIVIIARPGDIPRTTSGKLKRAACKQLVLAQIETATEGS